MDGIETKNVSSAYAGQEGFEGNSINAPDLLLNGPVNVD